MKIAGFEKLARKSDRFLDQQFSVGRLPSEMTMIYARSNKRLSKFLAKVLCVLHLYDSLQYWMKNSILLIEKSNKSWISRHDRENKILTQLKSQC